MADLTVRTIGDERPVLLAGDELARCLAVLTGGPVRRSRETVFSPDADGIWLGVETAIPGARMAGVADALLDDAVAIDVHDGNGAITGPNPRSVLLAAYRFLRELGCRWVRPGPDGEYIPTGVTELSATVIETPAYRHRGVCIEGAVSEQHVRNMIEWLPRAGMNAYFTQFREAFTFFHRYYSHAGNPFVEPADFTTDHSRAILSRLTDEIAARGLIYHAVGHGWTCEPFGMPGLGWEFDPVTATPEIAQYLAMVDGKREVWGGIPLNTNLCYSNPTVRRIMVDDIVEYAEGHPEVHLLHVWLADGANNSCECAGCRAARPSDFYVRILNELDAELTRRNIATRIVFLIYVDLLWPPERERIVNPDRFVLMFAPITRSYSRSFGPTGEAAVELPPFERNHLQFPRDVDENLAFLRAWSPAFAGDGFDFDYHFMWDHYNDPGGCASAAVVHEDVGRLADIGLRGFMSCQTQRACFPTGLAMYAMASALWDPSRSYADIEQECLAATFGPDWKIARAYLSAMTEMFDPVAARGEKALPGVEPGNAHCDATSSFARIPSEINTFRPVFAERVVHACPVWAASWRYLQLHADICEPLARAYAARAAGDAAAAHAHWQEAVRVAWHHEPELENVLDVYLMVDTLRNRFRAP